MADDDALARPVGWWVREVDRRLDAAFDAALAEAGATRRQWQMLVSLEAGSVRSDDLLTSLAPFGPVALLAAELEHLIGRGAVERTPDGLALTQAGRDRLAALRPAVAEVRRRVTEALPGDDYATLVRLLARLARGLADGAGREVG